VFCYVRSLLLTAMQWHRQDLLWGCISLTVMKKMVLGAVCLSHVSRVGGGGMLMLDI